MARRGALSSGRTRPAPPRAALRMQYEREMARAAQRHRATRDACGGYSGSHFDAWHRPVRRHPERGGIIGGREAYRPHACPPNYVLELADAIENSDTVRQPAAPAAPARF